MQTTTTKTSRLSVTCCQDIGLDFSSSINVICPPCFDTTFCKLKVFEFTDILDLRCFADW